MAWREKKTKRSANFLPSRTRMPPPAAPPTTSQALVTTREKLDTKTLRLYVKANACRIASHTASQSAIENQRSSHWQPLTLIEWMITWPGKPFRNETRPQWYENQTTIWTEKKTRKSDFNRVFWLVVEFCRLRETTSKSWSCFRFRSLSRRQFRTET